jgi:hemerythrin-like domain-containing protein
MMKKPTKILSDEHLNILKVIEALSQECDSIDSRKELDKDFFKNAIFFIRNYADRFHHAKEEDILFKELCKDSVEMHCNPTDVV